MRSNVRKAETRNRPPEGAIHHFYENRPRLVKENQSKEKTCKVIKLRRWSPHKEKKGVLKTPVVADPIRRTDNKNTGKRVQNA